MKKIDFLKIIPEAEQQKRCLEMLRVSSVIFWRSNTGGAVYTYEHKTGIKKGTKTNYRVPFGFKGMPDICGYVPKFNDEFSVPFFWEVKRYGKKPTKLQQQFIDTAKEDGCLAGWGTADDLESFLNENSLFRN